jgi:hypothetical protein
MSEQNNQRRKHIMTPSNAITVTLNNPTAGQLAALSDILNGVEQNRTSSEEADKPKTRKNARPPKTVSHEEDEEFGTEGALDEEDLEVSSDDTESEDTEDESVSWEDVTEALNTYGGKHPDEAKAILLGFNIKSTKELKAHKNKWEPVYRKVMAKLKKAK